MITRAIRMLAVAALGLSPGLWSACAPPVVAPPYPGGLAEETPRLAPFSDGESGISMRLPWGWVPDQAAWGDPELRARFKKENTSAILQVFCQDDSVSRAEQSAKLLGRVRAIDPAAKRHWPRYSMGGKAEDAEFSAWGAVLWNVPMRFYLAWKPPRGSGCKYGLVLGVSLLEAHLVEGDFLAIVRTLD